MTGREALIEAMRHEQAAIYGHLQPEHNSRQDAPSAPAFDLFAEVCGSLRAGHSNSGVMQAYSVDYEYVRRARKTVMRGAA